MQSEVSKPALVEIYQNHADKAEAARNAGSIQRLENAEQYLIELPRNHKRNARGPSFEGRGYNMLGSSFLPRLKNRWNRKIPNKRGGGGSLPNILGSGKVDMYQWRTAMQKELCFKHSNRNKASSTGAAYRPLVAEPYGLEQEASGLFWSKSVVLCFQNSSNIFKTSWQKCQMV